jgi:hypothetical protein
MDLLNFYQVQGPFPFAAAIVALSAAERGLTGECFLLVENGRAFLGFQRHPLPQEPGQDEALARMLDEVRRIHRKMIKAANRNGLLPASDNLENSQTLQEVAPGFLQVLWDRSIFAPHLRWIGQKTASRRLSAQIADRTQARSASNGIS